MVRNMNPQNSKHNQTDLRDFKIPNPEYGFTGYLTKEERKMVKLSEEATNYESPTTKNIAELGSVDKDVEIYGKDVLKDDGKTVDFSYKYIEVAGEEYRVPNIVLKQLQTHIKENPNFKTFKVKKEGEGKYGTRYTVIPL